MDTTPVMAQSSTTRGPQPRGVASRIVRHGRRRPSPTLWKEHMKLVLILAGIAGLGLAMLGVSIAQPEGPSTVRPAKPVVRQPGDAQPSGQDVNELWLPPGNYSSLVISTTATERTWWLSLDTDGGTFPVTIGPQQTVTIDFDPPWKVDVSTNARLTSKYVPFGEYAEFNPLNNQRVQLFAWGITTTGPMKLVPPRNKK